MQFLYINIIELKKNITSSTPDFNLALNSRLQQSLFVVENQIQKNKLKFVLLLFFINYIAK